MGLLRHKGSFPGLDRAAVHRKGPALVSAKGLLSTKLLLVAKFPMEPELFLTWFLPRVCFLVLSQERNVFQDQASCLTGVGLQG